MLEPHQLPGSASSLSKRAVVLHDRVYRRSWRLLAGCAYSRRGNNVVLEPEAVHGRGQKLHRGYLYTCELLI